MGLSRVKRPASASAVTSQSASPRIASAWQFGAHASQDSAHAIDAQATTVAIRLHTNTRSRARSVAAQNHDEITALQRELTALRTNIVRSRASSPHSVPQPDTSACARAPQTVRSSFHFAQAHPDAAGHRTLAAPGAAGTHASLTQPQGQLHELSQRQDQLAQALQKMQVCQLLFSARSQLQLRRTCEYVVLLKRLHATVAHASLVGSG